MSIARLCWPLSRIQAASRGTTPRTSIVRRNYATEGQSIAPVPGARENDGRRERLVVLGSGWGGFTFLKKLDRSKYDVVLVSPNTYFSFTPLLAQASVGTLEFRDVIEPVRSQADCTFHHSWCESIDFDKRELVLTPAQGIDVRVEDPWSKKAHNSEKGKGQSGSSASEPSQGEMMAKHEYTVPYDKLVVSVGSYNQTFDTPGVKEHAWFLKDANDARAIRWRIVELLEQASFPWRTDEERRKMLSFVVVGGGPTGAEWSAELHDLVEAEVKRLFPSLHPLISIHLLDAGPGILSSFDKSLSDYALRKFSRDGIDIRLKQKITRVEKSHLVIDNGEGEAPTELPFGLLVWSTGVKASPLIEQLTGVRKDTKTKSILTDGYLRALKPGKESETEARKDVFALGDCAIVDGNLLPATAQVATQKATYLAKLFNNDAKMRQITDSLSGGGGGGSSSSSSESVKKFAYSNKGAMASIGGAKALIDLPNAKEAGFLAWVGWRGAYTVMAMTWRNRLAVPFTWFLNLLFGRDLSRF